MSSDNTANCGMCGQFYAIKVSIPYFIQIFGYFLTTFYLKNVNFDFNFSFHFRILNMEEIHKWVNKPESSKPWEKKEPFSSLMTQFMSCSIEWEAYQTRL